MPRRIKKIGITLLLLSIFSVLMLQIERTYATTGSFGYSSIGASSDGFANTHIVASKFQYLGITNGTVTKFSLYVTESGINFKYAIYSDNSGTPNALLDNGTSDSPSTGNAWVASSNLDYAILTQNVWYWFFWKADASFHCSYSTNDTNNQAGYYTGKTYTANWGSTAGGGLNINNEKYSVFINYTTATPDTVFPTYSLINSSTVIPSQICIFSCNWTDNIAMDWYVFGWNNSGTWINDSAAYFNAGSWANITKTLNATGGAIIQFEWWANDTSNNWNNTGIQSITLTSTDVLPYLAMGGILGGTGVMAIFLIRKRRE